jgi:hypothetical protein
MISQILHQLDKTTELLQYFAGSTAIVKTARTFTATGIHTGLTVGDKVVIAGTSSGTSDGTYTVETLSTGVLTTVETPAGSNETATITINQEYQGVWVNIERWAKLTGSINCSGAAYVYIDQSADGSSVDYTTTLTITGGTASAWSIEAELKYARMRIRTNAADQTIMRAYLFGRAIT